MISIIAVVFIVGLILTSPPLLRFIGAVTLVIMILLGFVSAGAAGQFHSQTTAPYTGPSTSQYHSQTTAPYTGPRTSPYQSQTTPPYTGPATGPYAIPAYTGPIFRPINPAWRAAPVWVWEE